MARYFFTLFWGELFEGVEEVVDSADELVVFAVKHIRGVVVDDHVGVELLIFEGLAVAVKGCYLRYAENQ